MKLRASWLAELIRLDSGCSRLEHRQSRRILKVARRDSFEVCANATQFGSYKGIDKVQAPVEPGK